MSESDKNSNVLHLRIRKEQETRKVAQSMKPMEQRLEEAEQDIDRLIQLVLDLVANCDEMRDRQNTLVRTLFRKRRQD